MGGGIGSQATEYKSWEREEGGGRTRPNKCKFSIKKIHGRGEGVNNGAGLLSKTTIKIQVVGR